MATAVTGSNVITKIIQVDTNINESELRTRFTESSSSPFLDEVSLDFEILGMAGDNGRQEVLLRRPDRERRWPVSA
jgi:type IV pilus assembly protein PilM